MMRGLEFIVFEMGVPPEHLRVAEANPEMVSLAVMVMAGIVSLEKLVPAPKENSGGVVSLSKLNVCSALTCPFSSVDRTVRVSAIPVNETVPVYGW